MIIREERPNDAAAVYNVIAAAFATADHSNGREQDLIDALRAAGALVLSLVAEVDGEIRGHVAFTEVTIDGRQMIWHGLGPISVAPRYQRQGIGRRLIETGLSQLRQLGSQGCVVVGEPGYYQRFGFAADADLKLDGIPPEFFMALRLGGEMPRGAVAYNKLFFEMD